MDENARQFGLAERAKALKLRDESQVIIDYWDRLLGVSASSPSDEQMPEFTPGGSGSEPRDFVVENELIGMSAPRAIKMVMERMVTKTGSRRPLRVVQIHSLLAKGGIDYKKDRLYTTLMRSPMFHTPQKGLWGLTEWYPGSAKKATNSGESTPGGTVTDLRAVQADPASAVTDPLDRAEGE